MRTRVYCHTDVFRVAHIKPIKVWGKLDNVGQSENSLLFLVKTSKFDATPQENWDKFTKVRCGHLITFDHEGVKIGHTKFELAQSCWTVMQKYEGWKLQKTRPQNS